MISFLKELTVKGQWVRNKQVKPQHAQGVEPPDTRCHRNAGAARGSLRGQRKLPRKGHLNRVLEERRQEDHLRQKDRSLKEQVPQSGQVLPEVKQESSAPASSAPPRVGPALAAPRNLPEMQFSGGPRPTASGTLGVQPSKPCFNKPPR